MLFAKKPDFIRRHFNDFVNKSLYVFRRAVAVLKMNMPVSHISLRVACRESMPCDETQTDMIL